MTLYPPAGNIGTSDILKPLLICNRYDCFYTVEVLLLNSAVSNVLYPLLTVPISGREQMFEAGA